MGLFEHWPYTNFHDLNLNWIIDRIKFIQNAVPVVTEAMENAAASAEASAESAEASSESASAAALSAESAEASAESAAESAAAAAGIVGYVTPEMFGAVGDGVTDDITAIQDCLNSGAKHVVMSKNYYVSEPITNVESGVLIDGNGSITAETEAFQIDGKRQFIIKDLTINFKTYGLHITSTSGYVQYGEFQNLVLNGQTETSVGVFIERTTSHLNELRFTNVICWTVSRGFVVYNPTTLTECAGHRFTYCAAENATDCGWDITNAGSITLLFSRIEEVSGYKIRSTGTCDRLTIVTTKLVNQQEQNLSNGTNGVILGCIRSGFVYDPSPGGYAKIVHGKIIPCDSMLTDSFNTDDLNTDKSYPFNNSTTVDTRNSWHKYASTATSLTLDPAYYGGLGLINDLYFIMGDGAGAVNITNGDTTMTIPSSTPGKTYHLKYLNVNNNRRWRYEELSSF